MTQAVTGHEFLDQLLQQTPAAATQPKRGQNYNYPLRYYLLPDGRVELLQGDPHNRAYYTDKGYHLLSDAPGRDGSKSEVRRYVEDAYPRLLAEQREKATIINAIRRACELDRNLNLEDDFESWTIADLRAYLVQVKEETGKTIHIVKRRGAPRPSNDEAAVEALLRGVDDTSAMSIEALQAKTQRKGS